MQIIKAYKTSKGIFKNRKDAELKKNRRIDEGDTFYYGHKTYEPVKEVWVIEVALQEVSTPMQYFELNEVILH
jgi:hypothetical protein